MSEQLRLLQDCINEAPTHKDAEEMLRAIIEGAAEHAPVDAIVEIGQTLVRIRKRDMRRELEKN